MILCVYMANRRFTSQFNYSFERMPVSLMASFEQDGSVGVFASLVDNGITYTADRMGAEGNDISIALVAGGTAGAEVVSVSGNAISVQIESGVSTRTQVKTALDASIAASALISVSVVSGGTAATLLAATPLAGGVDTVFSQTGAESAMSLHQSGTGIFELILSDSYPNLLSASIMLQRASGPVDLVPQLISVDPTSAKIISFRMNAAATPTNLADNDVLFIDIILRNSANPS